MIQVNRVLHTARGIMDTGSKYRFDPIDHNFMRLRGRLTPGERLLAMLAAREWVVSAKRARLCRRYPDLSPQEINLKVLEEIERAERRQTRPHAIS
jgi:hypothetical protein